MPTLKPHSNGSSYSNTVIGTLTINGRVVTFGTARNGLIAHQRPVKKTIIWCGTIILPLNYKGSISLNLLTGGKATHMLSLNVLSILTSVYVECLISRRTMRWGCCVCMRRCHGDWLASLSHRQTPVGLQLQTPASIAIIITIIRSITADKSLLDVFTQHVVNALTCDGHLKTAEQRTIVQQYGTVIGTLAVDGWAVTFGTARKGPSGCGLPSPLLAVPNVIAHCPPINSQCTNFIIRCGILPLHSKGLKNCLAHRERLYIETGGEWMGVGQPPMF